MNKQRRRGKPDLGRLAGTSTLEIRSGVRRRRGRLYQIAFGFWFFYEHRTFWFVRTKVDCFSRFLDPLHPPFRKPHRLLGYLTHQVDDGAERFQESGWYWQNPKNQWNGEFGCLGLPDVLADGPEVVDSLGKYFKSHIE